MALEQAALDSQGEYYLFLDTTDQKAGSVQFYINGTVVNSDNSYPYDLNGGATLATAQDMGLFVLGTNRVSAKIKGKIVDEAVFLVNAVTAEPTPDPEPVPEPEPVYTLLISTNADRSGASTLDGTLMDSTASYFIYLQTDDANADTVRFYLNGSLIQTEYDAPWDLAGGTESTATAVDMSVFVEGGNDLVADVDGVRIATANITVETPTEEPAPEPEPTPTIDVTLYWSPPATRENGDVLATSEIGGYEIRYRLDGSSDYTTVVINDGSVDQYLFQGLDDTTYQFEIAAFDQDGLYSEFVVASYNPHHVHKKPGSAGFFYQFTTGS
ncbi:fibronectin type III domain-containing protein [Saccharospirillum salsuginis]|uniref:Fibronectin type-III domain-containing protein n=1 Tax=Saccharospirillum salsuginis TaxID=418750 RepID=A0A918K7U6_9GAMM|nr:fibronectin type III domain-containing protein [Saccharospirillum salsuginis]GGX53533.1 hypothetical protein GCM10007392_21320 [Saccharospirillum salsuginis]